MTWLYIGIAFVAGLFIAGIVGALILAKALEGTRMR